MHKLPSALVTGVVLAVVTACSGSSSPANHAGGPPSGGPNASPTGSGSSTPSTAASASPGATATSTPTPATGHTVPTGPGSKPPGSPTGFTRAGTYTYDDSGTATTRLGTQKISGTETFAVDPPKGSTQKTTQKTQQGGRDQTLKATSAGLFVLDINIHQQTFREDFKPVGTAMYFPSKYHVGDSWKWSARSTDGNYRMDVSSKISSKTTITIHGQSIPVVVLDSVIRLSGKDIDLTDNQRDWVSTAYALAVKEHLSEHGTLAGFTFTSDETRTIRSTAPTSG